jgi:hypothetical protein
MSSARLRALAPINTCIVLSVRGRKQDVMRAFDHGSVTERRIRQARSSEGRGSAAY